MIEHERDGALGPCNGVSETLMTQVWPVVLQRTVTLPVLAEPAVVEV